MVLPAALGLVRSSLLQVGGCWLWQGHGVSGAGACLWCQLEVLIAGLCCVVVLICICMHALQRTLSMGSAQTAASLLRRLCRCGGWVNTMML